MSIIDALKKLVVAFGGADDPSQVQGDNIADVVDKLSEIVTPASGHEADIPTITMDSSTHICTFTEDQATYMKSGKPFLVRINDVYLLAMLHEWFEETRYMGTLVYGGVVFIGAFNFNTTTGYFYIPSSDVACAPQELYRSSVSEYKLQDGSSAIDVFDNDLSEKFFGFNELGTPGYYNVKMEILRANPQSSAAFVEVMTELQSQAAQTGQTANAYMSFDTSAILQTVSSAAGDGRNVALVVSTDDDPTLAIVAGLSSVLIMGLNLTCTFRGSLIIDETSGSPATYSTYDFELHFTPGTVAMSVSPPKTYDQIQTQ